MSRTPEGRSFVRLPAPESLTFDAARFLYQHDTAELHCSDEWSFYSQMHKQRLQAILEVLGQHSKPGRVLDLGSAQGNTSLTLAEAGYEAWAVDLRLDFLRYAGLKHERGIFRRVVANAEQLPFPPGFFETVIWGEMIEHVAHPETILGEIRRVLRPGGLLLLSTPNGARLRTGLPTFSQIKDRATFEARQFQPDSEGHLFLYRREELGPLLRAAGFGPKQHRFYATPWITGRLGFRHWMSWLNPTMRRWLDQWTLGIPPLANRLAEGQVALAVRNDP